MMGWCYGIKVKIFLPIIVLIISICSYTYFIWLPTSINYSINETKKHTNHTLATLSEGLVPLLLANKLSDIYDTVDRVLTENQPDWAEIRLINEKGQSLYPLDDLALPQTSETLHVMRYPLHASSTIGELILVYDFTRTKARIEQHGLELFLSIFIAITLFSCVIGLVLHQFILRPATRLADASNAMAEGNYDINLPDMKGGEMAMLLRSFSHMRDRVKISTAEMKAAQQETQKIAQIPMNNPMPLLQLSEDGSVIYANPAAEKAYPDIYEKCANHCLVQGIDALLIDKVLSTKQLHTREVVTNDMIYLQTIAPNFMQHQRTVTIYHSNITEVKEAQFLAEEAQEMAEDASRAKSEFLANMSHELRTPMNGIIGLSDLILDSELDDEQLESMSAINRSAEGLLLLLNDILDFSKIEAGEMTLEYAPFDLKQTIKDVLDILQFQAQKKGLYIRCNYSPTTPRHVVGDSARLRQILTNLIGNAIKFTENGGVTLDISTHYVSGQASIAFRVDDTGIGIPENRLESIFQKFTQADESTTRKFGGTGLGLSICKHLTEMMKGKIGVDSVVDQGSSFWFELPFEVHTKEEGEKTEDISFAIEPAAQAETRNDAPALQEGSTAEDNDHHVRILAVDDNPINLMFLRKLLKKMGYNAVQLANGGQEAIDYVKDSEYDLIFMDCQMPDMDGFQTTAAIREYEKGTGRHTPITALTANALKGDREKCLEAGMDDYATKPVKREVIESLISTWVSTENSLKDGPEARVNNEKMNSEDPIPPVDMERLNAFTDGDKEEEKMLCDIFFEQAEATLYILHNTMGDAQAEEWKSAAHKLKGSSANFGANQLSEKCRVAEEGYDQTALTKDEMVAGIVSELAAVRSYLEIDYTLEKR